MIEEQKELNANVKNVEKPASKSKKKKDANQQNKQDAQLLKASEIFAQIVANPPEPKKKAKKDISS